MKSMYLLALFTLMGVNAFSIAPTFTRPAISRATRVFADPSTDDKESFDLDLGEMFEMFSAAEKDEKFDDAIKKVKKGEKDK